MQIVAKYKHGKVLVAIIVGMRVLLWPFMTSTGDFEKIEGTSATISGVGDSVFSTALITFKKVKEKQ